MIHSAIETFLRKAARTWYPSGDRMDLLDDVTYALKEQLRHEPKPMLVFVCTHNSRRSHFARVWAEVVQHQLTKRRNPFAMESAGTEATACNPRMVASLERAGFIIEKGAGGDNPVYSCRYTQNEDSTPMKLWSKTLDDPAIKRPLLAVMTCSDADQNCPFVPGALARIRMTYKDPKSSDDTPAEAQTYDERSAQIAGELHYVLSGIY